MEDQQQAARRPARPLLIALLVAGLIALAALVGGIAYIQAGKGGTAAPKVSKPPVIANIQQPNAACWSAADRPAAAGDDVNGIIFVGYIDGQPQETVLYNSLMAQIRGQRVEPVWYCPPRSQWR
jgi:hypothetical protein